MDEAQATDHAGIFVQIRQRWLGINEWLRAFITAALLIVLLHLFVFRTVTVQSTSMYATLLPGDLVLVERWPIWTGLERGDIIVFRDPLKDRESPSRRPLVVKRIIGMPGDTVELRSGIVYVNGRVWDDPQRVTRSYLLRLEPGTRPDDLMELLGLPISLLQPGRQYHELPLNEALADSLEKQTGVVAAEPMGMAKGTPRHIFPFSTRFPWNGDDYGPIIVPAKGMALRLTTDNLPLYDRLISRYEGHALATESGSVLVDGRAQETYVVGQDHYFVLGDSRHHSADSRYWGFVPDDHLMGRASVVLLGSKARFLPRRSGRAL